MLNNEITAKQLTTYLSNVLNGNVYKKIIGSLSISNVESFFEYFVNIISKYYISTLDDSIENAEEICVLLFEYYNKDFNARNFFENILMDRIFSICANQMGIEILDVEAYYKITSLIFERNKKNGFFTHCFPGAIIETVNNEGLDASKICCAEEIKILNKYFQTPFKVGGLYYCELSSASLSYVEKNIPESIKFSLGGLNSKIEEETNYEMFIRSFNENLEKLKKERNLDDAEIERLKFAGERIIDFYCKTKKAGIAIFKDREMDADYKYIFDLLDCSREFKYNSFIFKKFKEIIKMMQSNPNNAFNIWNEEIDKICNNNPQLRQAINKIIKKNFSNHIQNCVIRNYLHGGYADGYEFPNGVLPRDKFDILEIDVPRELHIEMRRKQSPIIEKELVPNLNDDNFELQYLKKICDCIELVANTDSEITEVFTIWFNGINLLAYFSKGELKIYQHFCLEKGNEFYISNFQETYLERKIISEKVDEYIKNGNPVDKMVDTYKNSDEFDEEFDKGEDLVLNAVTSYFNQRYNELPYSKKQELLYKKSLEYESIILLYENGQYFVKNGDTRTPLKTSAIVSSVGDAPFNSLYSSIIESKSLNPKQKH